MAHIQRRGRQGDYRYRVRYIDPDGRERSRTFARKVDAERFLTSVQHSIHAGQYLDPDAGRVTLRAYAEEWRVQQAGRKGTVAAVERRLRLHVYPYLGDRPLSKVKPSDIRAWQAAMLAGGLSKSTAASVRSKLSEILDSAVTDGQILANPCQRVKAPKPDRTMVNPPTVDQVVILCETISDRYRAVIDLVAGSGMRHSEVFGLTVDRVDFLRRQVRVDRQLAGHRGAEPILGPPKSDASNRVIPLDDVTLEALAEHLAKYPAAPDELVFRTGRGGPVMPSTFSSAWRRAARMAGLSPGDGLHQLRHFYASMLIAGGRSPREVAARLGHDSPVITLNVYTHLWPSNEDGTRGVVAAVLGPRLGRARPSDDDQRRHTLTNLATGIDRS